MVFVKKMLAAPQEINTFFTSKCQPHHKKKTHSFCIKMLDPRSEKLMFFCTQILAPPSEKLMVFVHTFVRSSTWLVIFGRKFEQKANLFKRLMHESQFFDALLLEEMFGRRWSPKQNYWKDSCMNPDFLMLRLTFLIWAYKNNTCKCLQCFLSWAKRQILERFQ